MAGLGVGVFSLSSVAFTGYLVGAQSAYGWGQLTRMAVHTSLGFIVLSSGILTLSVCRSRTWISATLTSDVHDPVRERRRILGASISIMSVVSISVGLTMIWELYSTAVDEQRNHLVEMVKSRTEMIEAVARFDAENSDDVPGGARAATLSQVRDAHQRSPGFGRTGEFSLATRVGDEIDFLGPSRSPPGTLVETLGVGFVRAEPMRRALAGETGSLIGTDYLGNKIIAAYAFVPSLSLGVIARMDLAEVRAPFVRSALLTAVLAILIIGLGTGVSFVSIGPLVKRVEAQAEGLRTANVELTREAAAREESVKALAESEALLQGVYETYPDLQFVLEPDGTIERFSAPDETVLYVPPQEFMGQRMQDILPPDVGSLWSDALGRATEGLGTQSFEYSLSTTQDGDRSYEARVSMMPNGGFVAVSRDITDHKQAEEALRVSEDRFRIALKAPGLGVTHQDRDLRYTWVHNPHPDLEPGEVIGKTDLELTTEEDGAVLMALKRGVLESGIGRHEEIRYSINGVRHYYDITVEPLRDPAGHVVGVTTVAVDIDDRKVLEELLVFVAQRNWGEDGDVFLRSLASFLGTTLDVSHAFIDRLLPGGTKVHTVGLYSLGELVPDIAYDLEHTPCENVMAGEFCSFPSDVQQRFPQDQWLAEMGVESYAGMPLWDSSGNPIGLVGVMGTKPLGNPELVEKALRIVAVRAAHELEQQRSMEALRRSETIVANSSDMLALLDRNYTYLAVNPAYVRPFGLKAGEMIGNTVAEVFGEEFFTTVMQPHLDRCLEDVNVEYKTWIDYPVSGKSYMHVNLSPQLREDGEVAGFIVNVRDITELEEAQQSLSEMNLGLERLVKERTSQLVEANSELEAFTSSVSHDLKVPLRAIDGFAGMLVERHASALPEEAQRLLGVVRTSTKQMANLIDDLLDFSRLGRADKVITEVNMQELAQAVFSEIATLEEDREIEFSLDKLPTIQGDLGLLRQVWSNLLENALKFTGQTTVARIEVSCQHGSDHWVFCVRDNGAGFDMAYADKLFGVFQRLHDENDFPGTGVGLATVQRIIQRHGGEVWAEGEVDRGAKIFFRIPHTVEPT